MNQANLNEFEFIDFSPTNSVATIAKERLRRLFGESPSDSSARALLKRTASGFEGRLVIVSAAGRFFAEVIGDDPVSVVNSLVGRIANQLVDWRRARLPALNSL